MTSATSAETGPPIPRRTAALALVTLLAIMPVTLVVPALKAFVQDRFELDLFATSVFMSINMVGALIAAPLAGLLSDRLGKRRPLILVAFLVDAGLLLSLNLAPNYATLLALRLLEGATHIFSLSLLLAMAADHSRRVASGHVMGAVGACLTLGVAIGAPIGGLLAKRDLMLPMQLGAGLSILALLATVLLLRDDTEPRRPGSLREALRLITARRSLLVPYAFTFVDRFTVGFFISAFPLYMGNVHGYDPSRTGILLAFFLLPFALLSYPMGRLAQRGSRALFIGGGSIAYGLMVLTLGAWSAGSLPFLMVILGLCSSVMFVPTLMLAGELTDPATKATAMGGFNAAGSLGFLVGPLVAGGVAQLARGPFGEAGGFATAFVVAGIAEIGCVLATLPALRRLDRSKGDS